jgi:hypothetical protein
MADSNTIPPAYMQMNITNTMANSLFFLVSIS